MKMRYKFYGRVPPSKSLNRKWLELYFYMWV